MQIVFNSLFTNFYKPNYLLSFMSACLVHMYRRHAIYDMLCHSHKMRLPQLAFQDNAILPFLFES